LSEKTAGRQRDSGVPPFQNFVKNYMSDKIRAVVKPSVLAWQLGVGNSQAREHSG
jgi:hypothetical protein